MEPEYVYIAATGEITLADCGVWVCPKCFACVMDYTNNDANRNNHTRWHQGRLH